MGTLLRTIAQEPAFQIALRNSSKEVRKEPGYRGVSAEKNMLSNIKSTANHTKMIIVIFYVWEMQESRLIEIVS